MTDIADAYWPDHMQVDDVIFNKGDDQLRDELGMGYLEFDEKGKIKNVDVSSSCYTDGPKDPEAFNKQLANFTGILDLIDIGLCMVRGQLVFGYAVGMPTVLQILNAHYRTDGGRLEDNHTITTPLPEESVNDFIQIVKHLEEAMFKPLNQPLTMEDLLLTDNPLYVEGRCVHGPDYWLDLMSKLREHFQTGFVEDDDYGVNGWYEESAIHARSFPPSRSSLWQNSTTT